MSYVDELFSLRGKNAIVTGASRGLGKAISEALLRAGASVLMVDIADELETTYSEFVEDNLRVFKHYCDLRDENDIEQLAEFAATIFDKIDVLVNNAGVGFAQDFFQYERKKWDETYQVNLLAPFLLSRLVAKHMIKNKKGSVINITSLNSELAFPNNPAYPAFKAGLKQLGKSMSLELGKYNVRVNNVGPGYMKTKLTKPSWSNPQIFEERKNKTVLGRWGEAEDLAGVIVFLASDASSYITGQDIYVDGGWLIKGL